VRERRWRYEERWVDAVSVRILADGVKNDSVYNGMSVGRWVDGVKTEEGIRKAQSQWEEMRRIKTEEENWGKWAEREDWKFNGKKFQNWATERGSLAGFFSRIVIWVYCFWWAKRR
jgi:hypothetical protein